MIKNKISLLSLKKFFLKIPDILFTSANLKILYSIQPEVKGCLLDKLFLKLAYRGGEHKNLKIKKEERFPSSFFMVRSVGFEPTRFRIRPSNVRVCQFHHDRILYYVVIALQQNPLY